MLRRLPFAFLLLASTLALALGTSLAQDKPAAKAPLFQHENHVSARWSSEAVKGKLTGRDGEVARDCRGCHDYRPEVPAEKLDKPTDRCSRCHDPDGYWKETQAQTIDTSKARVDPAREADKLFKHSQHLKNDCAECHYEDAGNAKPPWRIKLPAENLENKAYCVKCHNDDSKPEVRKSFNKGLTEEAKKRAHASGAKQPLVFSHASHVSDADIQSASLETCKQCHASIESSKPDSLAETQFDTGACTKCHIGMSFDTSSKREDGELYRVDSPTAGVFSHSQHLGKGTGKAGVKPIGAEGCLRCHEFETSPKRKADEGVRSFTLKPFLQPANGKGGFHGCIECHAEFNIPDHGNVDACAQCHTVEAGSLTTRSAMAENRPQEVVKRADPASFSFERQSHKFIAKGLTADAPESCADCHKAKLEAQPSRISNKAFSHATHLPLNFADPATPKPSSACTKCHESVAISKSLGKIEIHYDSKACVECHGKTEPTPTLEKNPVTKLYRFDHQQHVGKNNRDGKPVACADCHLVSAAGGQPKIALVEKIAECTLCHSHPAKPEGKVNRFSLSTVQSCATCHAAGVPTKGEIVQVGRARLVSDGGSQVHEGDARCTSCHKLIDKPFDANSSLRTARNPIVISVKNTTGQMETPHEARIALRKQASASPADQKPIQYFWNDVACIDCHFNSARADLVNEAYVKAAAKETRLERVKALLSDRNWRETYRSKVGDELGGPGTDYPTGFPGISGTR